MGTDKQMEVFMGLIDPYRIVASSESTNADKEEAAWEINNALLQDSYTEPPSAIMYRLRLVLAEALSTFGADLISKREDFDGLKETIQALTAFCEVLADGFYNIGIAARSDDDEE